MIDDRFLSREGKNRLGYLALCFVLFLGFLSGAIFATIEYFKEFSPRLENLEWLIPANLLLTLVLFYLCVCFWRGFGYKGFWQEGSREEKIRKFYGKSSFFKFFSALVLLISVDRSIAWNGRAYLIATTAGIGPDFSAKELDWEANTSEIEKKWLIWPFYSYQTHLFIPRLQEGKYASYSMNGPWAYTAFLQHLQNHLHVAHTQIYYIKKQTKYYKHFKIIEFPYHYEKSEFSTNLVWDDPVVHLVKEEPIQ